MGNISRRVIRVLLTVILALGFQLMPFSENLDTASRAYADSTFVKSQLSESVSAIQGDEDVAVTIELENTGTGSVTFDSAILGVDPSDNIIVSGGLTGTTTIATGQKANIVFYLNIGRYAETGTHTFDLTLKNGSAVVHKNEALGIMSISDKLSTPSKGEGTYAAAMDISHKIAPEAGFSSGQDNVLQLELHNIGNTIIKNSVLTITLPDGLSVNDASNSISLGYFSTDTIRKVSFPVFVDEGAATKNYAVVVLFEGLDYSNNEVSISKTFYLPVNGSGTSIKNAEITNIVAPDQVQGEDDFYLTFDVENKNSAALKNVKVSVDVPEGLLNKTKTTFIEASIPGMGKKSYSITLSATDGAKEKAYPIKISLSSGTSTNDTNAVVQYASVYISGVAGVKTPQLMVDKYSYGGLFVQAGEQFILNIGLYNTSATKTLSNIKVTVSSEDGSIIPMNGSNAFFIDQLEKKGHTEQTLNLSVKPTAEQKTTPLTVDMSYEDGAGNAFTSKDTISIQVMQKTRLEVDDIIAPPELYAAMPGSVSIQFYNMGKTILNNLRVTATGDFDTQESTSYFAGNMEGGKSDTYDFTFIPRQAGPMEGIIAFTYEDASGNEQVLEKPFTFEVMDALPVMDPGVPLEDGTTGTKGKLPWSIGGALLIILGIGALIFRKIRKKKKIREMEIDE